MLAIGLAACAVLAVQTAVVLWPRPVGPRPVPAPSVVDRVRATDVHLDGLRAAVALLAGAMAIPIGLRLVDPAAIVYGGNDLGAHAGWASEVTLVPLSVPQPHFGLHVLARLVMVVSGTARPDLAVVAVVAALVAAGAWLLYGYLANRAGAAVGRLWVAGATLLIVVGETPSAFFRRPSDIGGGTGYLALHQWATPTNAALLPVVVLLLPRLLRALDRPLSRRAGAGLAAVVVLGMVAKPNAPLVLVPAAFVVAALAVRPLARAVPAIGRLALWGALPLLVIGAWQAWFVSGLGADRDGGFRLALLHEMRIAGVLRPGAWLALVLPLVLLLAGGGRWWRNRSVQLGLAAFAVGLIQFAVLGETGYRRDHVNWGISAYAGFLALTVVAVGRALEQLGGRDRRTIPPAARLAVGAVVVITFAAGALAWVDSTGLG